MGDSQHAHLSDGAGTTMQGLRREKLLLQGSGSYRRVLLGYAHLDEEEDILGFLSRYQPRWKRPAGEAAEAGCACCPR